jgi:hypothetical protein
MASEVADAAMRRRVSLHAHEDDGMPRGALLFKETQRFHPALAALA